MMIFLLFLTVLPTIPDAVFLWILTIFLWILGISAALLIIAAILIVVPIRVEAMLKDGNFSIIVRILGLKFRRKISFDDSDNSDEKNKKLSEKLRKKEELQTEDDETQDKISINEKIYDLKLKIYMARHILQDSGRYLSRKMIFESFVLKIRFGDGNAATTGIEAGIIWGIIGSLVAALNNLFILETPADVNVLPEFNQKMLDLYIFGIIRTRLVHIIIAAIIGVKIYKKYDKNAD